MLDPIVEQRQLISSLEREFSRLSKRTERAMSAASEMRTWQIEHPGDHEHVGYLQDRYYTPEARLRDEWTEMSAKLSRARQQLAEMQAQSQVEETGGIGVVHPNSSEEEQESVPAAIGKRPTSTIIRAKRAQRRHRLVR